MRLASLLTKAAFCTPILPKYFDNSEYIHGTVLSSHRPPVIVEIVFVHNQFVHVPHKRQLVLVQERLERTLSLYRGVLFALLDVSQVLVHSEEHLQERKTELALEIPLLELGSR
jgi:hypothetical protein